MSDKREAPGWLLRRPIAHRGLFNNPTMPENSLAAFSAASRGGVPIELDVRLLSDGQPVVFHDEDTARMTNTAGRVEDLISSQCAAMRLLGTEEPVPLLRQVLESVAGTVPLLIEIKAANLIVQRLMDAVLACLRDYRGEFAVQSFNPAVLLYLRQNAPQIFRGQLSMGIAGIPLRPMTRPDFIAYDIRSLPHRGVGRLRDAGMPLLAWTIRTSEERERARTLADNYIFETDLPIEQYLAGPEPGEAL